MARLKLSLLLIPIYLSNVQSALAQNEGDSPVVPDNEGDSPVVTPRGGSGSGSTQLENPLGNQSLIGFFNSILDVLLIFAVPIIVFFIIFAGFKYVFARGNPEEISTANKALLYAVIGGVLILGAKVLLAVISGTIDQLAI